MIETIEFFATHVLNLTPVERGSCKGFYATVKRSKPKQKRRTGFKRNYITFFVSHEQVLMQYSAANRYLRGLPYDTTLMNTTIEGTPYVIFAKEVNSETYMFRRALTPGMEMLIDQPLTGGKE